MVLNIAESDVLAFVTEEGGLTSHATILAQNYGVPIVFGVKAVENIGCGDKVIVDASMGKILVKPDKKTERYYDKKIEEAEKRKKYCVDRVEISPRTKKGLRLTLKANISLQAEIKLLRGLNYDGVGLLRSEFLFSNRHKAPSEEDWFRVYKSIAETAKDKKIDCQVSMERRMACGFGVCQSCAVECKVPGSQETVYKLCCEDGPVFESKDVAF